MKENRLEELKQEYESIPVPEDLAFRVRSSMEQAKQAQKKEIIKMKPKRYIKNASIAAAAALLAVVILVNSNENIANAMEQVPVLGAVSRVVTFRTYNHSTGDMSAHVTVPKVEGGSEALNQSIQDYTDEIIAQYQADVKAAGGDGKLDVNLSYEVVTDNDSIFALRFDKCIVMASGSESVKIYNVDKASGKILTLKDLFQNGSDYIEKISQNIKEQMREQMAADENISYFLDDPEMSESNFTSISENATFYVNGDGNLVIVFDEYTVAPGYMGVTEFIIPSTVTSTISVTGYLK